MAISTTPPNLGDQYHHEIPRFILRRFQNSPSSSLLSHKDCQKLGRKAAKKKTVIDPIFYYDLSTKTLKTPSLSRSYGKMNLYRDGKNVDNVNYLECKFSGLEQRASKVIQSIHSGLQRRSFTIPRLELETLRQFIFLMHYRSNMLSTTYFQEDNPKNAPLGKWIRKYKESRQLSSGIDVWRDGLKYYLETPHQQIVTVAEEIRAKYGNHRYAEMLRTGVDPELGEKWFAMDYESQANHFFLGVWEAADDAEFLLGGHGFGLWEGLVYRSLGAHKLYVVSPQIAIVLRHTILHTLRSDNSSVLESSLADINIYQPKVEYADKSIRLHPEDWNVAKVAAYRSSPQAQKDLFTFPITKLDTAQTYAVNEVVLMNADTHSTGALTFASPTAMVDTLNRYMTSPNTFVARKNSIFRPLMDEILKMLASNNPPVGILSDKSPTMSCDTATDADYQLNIFLRSTILKGVNFTSLYNRAFLIYHMATDAMSLSNSVSAEIRRISEEGISRLRLQVAFNGRHPSSMPYPQSTTTTTTTTLVETLSKEDSDIFFARFGGHIDELGVGRRSNAPFANIIYEAAMIGIAHWLAETRPDVLNGILQSELRITA